MFFGYLWWLVGFSVALLWIGLILGPILPFSFLNLPVPAGMGCALGILLIVVGFFIMALGFVAARLKVQSELTAEEVWRLQGEYAAGMAASLRQSGPPPPPP